MDHSLFISDLHLCESRPKITNAFISFLKHTASQANALYILGDFFEYWPGDDAIEAGMHKEIIYALQQLSQHDVDVFFMHGNRDFLAGSLFIEVTGVQPIDDPTQIKLYGKNILLSHGDALCTDDLIYQELRLIMRSESWQSEFLREPLETRITNIEEMRKKSEQEKSGKTLDIMDVNNVTVENLLRAYDYPPILIHGHTHRPNRHLHHVDNHACVRWVLADWYEQGSYLMMSNDDCASVKL